MKLPRLNSLPSKKSIYNRFTKNQGTMLMHTGAIGWAASSAAQITGMVFNDKIDSNKKQFLIPQECADAAGNIALYYVITSIAKKTAEGLFDYGRIRLESVSNALKELAEKNGCTVKSLFDETKKVGKTLENNKATEILEHFYRYRNGASVIATLIASVISCNVLTPYFRNYMGSKAQEKAAKRATEAKIMIFDLQSKAEAQKKKTGAFKNFFV